MSIANYSQLGNKYILLDLLGIGGMAEVYRCKLVGQQGFEKIIVLKKLQSEAVKDKELVANFIDEARLAALLQHENIGHVYDFGEIDGNYFIAMEYLFGKDLFTIVQRAKEKKGHVDVEPALAIISKICEGMGYAHSLKDLHGRPLNIIHRDLSPHNVFVTYDGKVKIIDFGVARAELFDNRTRAGVVKGKISYMSPEQLTEKKVDHRSDIFSIGILLYEMLSGKRMYEGDTASLIRKGMQVDYVRLEAIAPGLPNEVYGIVDKALRIKKGERYQSCTEMSADIDDFLYHLQQRPSAQKLKDYMLSLFRKEYAAEKAKLIETADKFDEIHESGEKKSNGEKTSVTKPVPEDQTLIVDTLDDGALPENTASGEKGSSAVKNLKKFMLGTTIIVVGAGILFYTLEKRGQWYPQKEAPAVKADIAQKIQKAGNNLFRNKDVEDLLEKAEEALGKIETGKSRFVEASAYFQQVLKIDPGNVAAFNGMRRVYESYAGLVNKYLADNEFNKAEEVVRSAQLAFPGSERISALNTNVQSKKKQMTAELIGKAENAFAGNDLTTPVGSSAYFYYQKILEFDSENKAARDGLSRIADRYAAMAEASFKDISLSQTHIYAERGLTVVPDHARLQELKKSVSTKYIELVEGALAENDFIQAEHYIESALSVFPESRKFTGFQAAVVKKRKQLLEDLREKGENALENDDLTTPTGTSAYSYFQKILEYDSDNDAARKGLQKIGDRYANFAAAAYRKRNYPKAIVYVERGLSVVPKHSRLLKIKKDLAERYIALVKKDLAQGDWKKAEQHALEIEKIFPQDSRVKALQAAIGDRKKQLVKGLRLKAQRALSSNNLTTPTKTSAYTYYSDILKLDSNNTDALNGLQKIADKYAVLADESYRDLNFSKARVFVERGLMVVPQHKRLLEIKSDLSRSKPGIIFKAIKKNIESTF